VGRVLGRGEHGEVRLGRLLPAQELVAIKVVNMAKGGRMFHREVDALQRVNSDRVVKSLGWLVQGEVGYLILQYLPWPTLELFLQHGPLREPIAMGIMLQLLDGVAALHAAGVVHRDLKTANILIDPETKSIKIIDFGLSAHAPDGQVHLLPHYRWHDYVGTPCNMSPELLRREEYSASAADAWALGIVLVEMLLGEHPYAAARNECELEQMQSVSQWERFAGFSQTIRTLLSGLLAKPQTQRCLLPAAYGFLWQVLAQEQQRQQQAQQEASFLGPIFSAIRVAS